MMLTLVYLITIWYWLQSILLGSNARFNWNSPFLLPLHSTLISRPACYGSLGLHLCRRRNWLCTVKTGLYEVNKYLSFLRGSRMRLNWLNWCWHRVNSSFWYFYFHSWTTLLAGTFNYWVCLTATIWPVSSSETLFWLNCKQEYWLFYYPLLLQLKTKKLTH